MTTSSFSLKNLLPSFDVYQEKRLAAFLEFREAALATWEEELKNWGYLTSAKGKCKEIVNAVRTDICEAIQQGESKLEIVLPDRFNQSREKIYKIVYLTLEKEFIKEDWYLSLNLPENGGRSATIGFVHKRDLLLVKREVIDTKMQIKTYI